MEIETSPAILKLPSVAGAEDKGTIPTSVMSKVKVIKCKEERFVLPPTHTYFVSPKWMPSQMQILKDDLMKVKSTLNGFRVDEWHLHTRNMNPLSSVIKEIRQSVTHEFCTVAWCKLFEILSCHQVIPKPVEEAGHQLNEIGLGSVHLCEAPGAFIAALNHYLKTRYQSVHWDWLATTLSPYYEGNDRSETLIQDQIILSTLSNWVFLEDDTGNIMHSKNILHLRNDASKRLKNVHLVTADGSVDCADAPEDQEIITSDLHYCEIMAALSILDQGGSLLLKMFTFFECNSISKLYLLSCFFEEVEVVKPTMSKEGNSEVYIVCRGFAGQGFLAKERQVLLEFCDHLPSDKSLFPFEAIPEMFLNRVIDCSLYFATCQARVICRNVDTLSFGPSLYRMMGGTKQMLASQWFCMTGVASLAPANFLLHLDKTKKKYHFLCKTPQQYGGSYNDRISRIELKHRPGWLDNLLLELNLLSKTFLSKSIEQDLPRNFANYFVKYGKLYDNIKCSRFCDDKVLQFNRTVKEYIQYASQTSTSNYLTIVSYKLTPLCFCSSFQSHSQKFSEISQMDNPTVTKVLCYNPQVPKETLLSSDYEIANHFFLKLVQTISELRQGDNLFLCSYPLLTRFHFGFILILQQLFRCGKIILEYQSEQSPSSQGILLSDFLGINPSTALWSDLRSMAVSNTTSSHSQSQLVVEVIAITALCRKNLCEKAVCYNNHLIITNLQWKLEMAKLLFSSQDHVTTDVEMVDVF